MRSKILLFLTLFCLQLFAQQNCNDKIFVTTTGGGTGLAPNSPTTFTNALSMITATRNHVMIASGSYTVNAKVSVPSNAILDGRYSYSATQWTKSSANTSTLNITPALQTNTVSGVTTGNYVAIELVNKSNVYIKDLNIKNLASASGTTSSRGRNVYGIYASNSSNFYFSRLDIQTSNASNGADGADGDVGFNGETGIHGHDGDNDGADKCDDGAAYGGIAGHGGNGGGGSIGGDGAQFCNRQYGGAGEAGTGRTGGAGGGGGSGSRMDSQGARAGGRGGSTGDGTLGGTGGAARNDDDGGAGYDGSIGANGPNASISWVAGNRPTNYTYNTYFIPGAQADNGSGGFGGAGGGAGGGGGDQSKSYDNDGSGAGGGGGGGGGQGGEGGSGAFGGGGNFGVYASGGATKFLYDILFSLGNAGDGGTGGDGGNGGTYGSGNIGGREDEVGNGGNGARGGTGGDGGRGRDGANGVKSNQYNTTLSGTSVPNPTTLTTTAYGGCTNSVFDYTKGSGSWAGLSFINDINASNTSYTNTSSPVKVYYTSTGHKTINVSSTNYTNFDYVGTIRTLPSVTLSDNQICVGGSIDLSATSWGTETQYQWQIFRGDESTDPLVWSSVLADPNGAGPFNTVGDYLVKYQVFESCCGWSIPIYEDFEVVSNPVAPTLNTAVPSNNSSQCINSILKATTNVGSGGISCSDEYRYTIDGGTTWNNYTPGTNIIGSNVGTNVVKVQARRLCSGGGCDGAAETFSTIAEWSIVAEPIPGTATPNQTLCIDENASNIVLSGNNSSVIRWEIDDNPTFASSSIISNTTTTLLGSSIDAEIGTNNNILLYVRAIVDSVGCEASSAAALIRYNQPDDIVMADATGDCVSNQVDNWVNIYDPVTGRIIASVNDNNQNIGQVDASVYYHGGNAFNITTLSGGCGTQAVLNRSFVLNATNSFVNPVDIRFYFTDAELNDLITLAGCGDANGCEDDDDVCGISNLKVTQVSGASNEDGVFDASDGIATFHSTINNGTGNLTFGANYIQISVNSFSEFWIHGSEHNTTLPVDLLSFSVYPVDNNYIACKWTTLTEVNNDGFELQRSINGIDFEKLAWIEGNGNSTDINSYLYEDKDVAKNIRYYYRIKQIDFNGVSEFFNIASAKLDGDVNGFVFGDFIPNPTKVNTTTSLEIISENNEEIEVVIHNSIGMKVNEFLYQLNIGENSIEIDTKEFSRGVYFIIIHGSFGKEIKKLNVID